MRTTTTPFEKCIIAPRHVVVEHASAKSQLVGKRFCLAALEPSHDVAHLRPLQKVGRPGHMSQIGEASGIDGLDG